MLSNITWVQFFLFFGATTLLWALYVFKDSIFSKGPPGDKKKSDAAGKRVWSVTEQPETPPLTVGPDLQLQGHWPAVGQAATYEAIEDEGANEFDLLEQLVYEIENVISAYADMPDKGTLLALIAPLVQQYPQLNEPNFKLTVHHLIEKAALANYQLTITQEDTNALWQVPSA